MIIEGSCLPGMSGLPDNSVGLVVADLPYGITACSWDTPIDLPHLWSGLNRVCRPNAAMVFFGVEPFSSVLRASNIHNFRYDLVWVKPNGTNPFAARSRPMRRHEMIMVFYREQPVYHPQMVPGRPYKWASRRSGGSAGNIGHDDTPIDNEGVRYPSTVLEFKQDRGLHPTQKPVDLLRWLIRSYSEPGDLVFDPTAGVASTGVAALTEGRDFIGFETVSKYVAVGRTRLEGVSCPPAVKIA